MKKKGKKWEQWMTQSDNPHCYVENGTKKQLEKKQHWKERWKLNEKNENGASV